KNRLVYNSPSMRKVVSFAKKAAFSNSPILVTGESGVGKRLLCEFIHNYSDRSSNSILIINCSAISEQEFREKVNITQFGDEMNTSHIGYKMQYGTVCFENIMELNMEHQAMLKNFIEFVQSASKSVRIMVTTETSLYQSVKDGLFRKNLYYLLNAIQIELPALVDRKEDIIPLSLYFL